MRPFPLAVARPTRLALLASAVATIAALAGCGSSTVAQPKNDLVTTPAAPVTSAAPATTPAPTTAAASASPSDSGDPLRCHTTALTASPGSGQGAAGHLFLVVKLTNISSSTCHLFGFPGMGLLDASRNQLATTVVRNGGQLPQATPATVSLSAGAVASFTLSYSDVPTGSATCPEASFANVTPPDEQDPVLLTTKLAPCGGVIDVSPVVAGPDGVAP